ncbi:MAG: diaminopimelate epimerase [Alphaproteobacteria bacterium]|nr:diaminopimelate epimerase [Chthoniobacterales bacterium]MBY0463130.1 diaminopimelate epimerase [Alphaproteobacteria bacterium]
MSLSLEFTKMNGAGNDFVMLDNRGGNLHLTEQQIAALCDRHRGIGADGLLVLEVVKNETLYRMRYYNADGIEVEMCGNGARCFTRYLAQLEKLSGKIAFQTKAGIIQGALQGDQVQILMSTPFDLQLNELLSLDSVQELELHSINTGVPHAVLFVNNLAEAPVVESGQKIRHHAHFAPAGTNVNFVQIKEPQLLAIRTYERGVEDETLACGTGVVASALIHHLLSGASSPVFVITKGGDKLQVDFQVTEPLQINQVALTGPADFVFSGTISI